MNKSTCYSIRLLYWQLAAHKRNNLPTLNQALCIYVWIRHLIIIVLLILLVRFIAFGFGYWLPTVRPRGSQTMKPIDQNQSTTNLCKLFEIKSFKWPKIFGVLIIIFYLQSCHYYGHSFWLKRFRAKSVQRVEHVKQQQQQQHHHLHK